MINFENLEKNNLYHRKFIKKKKRNSIKKYHFFESVKSPIQSLCSK